MGIQYFILGYLLSQSGPNSPHPSDCNCESCVSIELFVQKFFNFITDYGIPVMLGLLSFLFMLMAIRILIDTLY